MAPRYEWIKALDVWQECRTPPSTLFKPVGFLDQEKVKGIMGNKSLEVAEADKGKEEKKEAQPSVGDQPIDLEEERKQREKDAEKAKELIHLRQRHYRKFYAKNLEDIKSIFDESIFDKIEIKRGASRGASSSFFSRTKRDASGQVTDEQSVGFFKGIVEVWNEQAETYQKKQISDKTEEIFELLKKIYKKVTNREFKFDKTALSSFKTADEVWQEVHKEIPDCFCIKKDLNYVFYKEKIKKELKDMH